MVSDFWHTSMRMPIVGQRLLVFEHAQTTGTHCSEILLDLGAYYRKVRFFLYFLFFFHDPVSVTGAWAWCGSSWLGCRELQAMRVVCLSGGWLWKWKPLDDPGTHYPQAIQLLMFTKAFCKSRLACAAIEVYNINVRHHTFSEIYMCRTFYIWLAQEIFIFGFYYQEEKYIF